MGAAGMGLIILGYALLWTGVERFRGNNVTLIETLGAEGGSIKRVSSNYKAATGSKTTPSSTTTPDTTSGGTQGVPA